MKSTRYIQFYIGILLLSFVCFPRLASANCLPAEIMEMFLVSDDTSGIKIAGVDTVTQPELDHIKSIYNRLLVRDDKSESVIRKAIERRKPVVLIFEDGDDYDEFYSDIDEAGAASDCYIQEVLQEEMILSGSGRFIDVTLGEMVHLIHLNGIQKAYPTWDRRLKQAANMAIQKGIFDKDLVEPPDMDDLEFAPQDDPDLTYYALYLSLGVEVYYGLWDGKRTVANGGYAFSNRDEMKEGDPALFELIEEIFPSEL